MKLYNITINGHRNTWISNDIDLFSVHNEFDVTQNILKELGFSFTDNHICKMEGMYIEFSTKELNSLVDVNSLIPYFPSDYTNLAYAIMQCVESKGTLVRFNKSIKILIQQELLKIS